MQQRLQTGGFITFVNDKLIARVTNALEAANYICDIGADNGLGNFINSALNNSPHFKTWRGAMPSRTPNALSKYQKEFPNYSHIDVDSEINSIGQSLADGQMLFHGGLWPGGNSDEFKLIRPFSTSFCPQVALRNAEHKGKAYDNNRINLFVLRATRPTTKVFSFRRSGTNLGHENEVLFASGAYLKLRAINLIRNDYLASKYSMPDKKIEIYVYEIDIS